MCDTVRVQADAWQVTEWLSLPDSKFFLLGVNKSLKSLKSLFGFCKDQTYYGLSPFFLWLHPLIWLTEIFRNFCSLPIGLSTPYFSKLPLPLDVSALPFQESGLFD